MKVRNPRAAHIASTVIEDMESGHLGLNTGFAFSPLRETFSEASHIDDLICKISVKIVLTPGHSKLELVINQATRRVWHKATFT